MQRARLGIFVALFAACSPKAKPNDVMGRPRAASEDADAGAEVPLAPSARGVAPSAAAGTKPRVVAKASSRALAVDATRIYFGDAFEDTVVCIAKEGGPIQRLARRAPVAGGLAIDGDAIAWVATPGDVVLRVSIGAAIAASGVSDAGAPDGGASDAGTPHAATAFLVPAIVREHGLFADVVAQGGDTFVAEAQGGGGTITRVDARGGATKLTSIDGAPRALALDATHVYIVTAQKVLRVPRTRGELETLTIGADFESPVIDGDLVYVVAATGAPGAHQVLRVKKTGGASETVAASVRAAPIAVDGGELFYFDPQRSRLLAQPVSGGTTRTLAQDDALSRPNAIAVDANAVYVATGEREDGAVLAIPRK
jgi:hypothetical protein